MQTFKAGDKVRCINPAHSLEGGEVYAVVSADEDEYLTVSRGCGKVLPFMYAWRFVKINPFKGNIK